MSNSDHRGAQASPRPDDMPHLVADLVKLSIDEVSEFSGYDVSACDRKIKELVTYIEDPFGPQRSVPQLLGQLAILYDRRSQLKAREHSEQISAMQAACQAELDEKSHLQGRNSCLQQEVDKTREEWDQALQECENLREQVKRQREREARDAGNALWTPGLETRSRTDISSGEASGIETPESQLQARPRQPQADETDLPWLINNVHRRSTPANARTEPAETPKSTVTFDYQATQNARPADVGNPLASERAPPVRNVPVPYQDDGRTPPWMAEGYSRSGRNLDDSHYPSTTQAAARSGSRSRPDWSFNPDARQEDGVHDQYQGGHDSDDSEYQTAPVVQGIRTRQIESLSKDIDRYDPDVRGSNVDDYLREVERCLLDIANPSPREKLKLVWKTTARNVHAFMETLSPKVRDNYYDLCQALREEYSLFTDQASATLGAFAVLQRKNETPREYYRRLRTAYFQGRNAPGLEEETAFKSLFLHNLHESVRYDVTMYCRAGNHSMQEMRRYSQLAWETRTRPNKGHEQDARVLGIQAQPHMDLALEGNEVPLAKTHSRREDRGRRPVQHDARRNQEREGSTQPRNQRSQYPTSSQQRGRDWAEQGPHQRHEKKYDYKYPKQGRPQEHGRKQEPWNPQENWKKQEHGRRQGPTNQQGRWNQQEPPPQMPPQMEDLIRRWVSEAVRNQDAPNSPIAPSGPPKNPDGGPPST